MYRTDICYTHVPDDWPLPADKGTYESYARLPAWSLEQAATLAAGYIPRTTDLHLCPDPAEPPNARRPYPDAKTWGQLIQLRDGAIRKILESFVLYARVYLPQFSWENPFLIPALFLESFDACDIPIARELRDAVREAAARWRDREKVVIGFQHGSHTDAQEWEASYRHETVQVARKLESLDLPMRQVDLLACINVEFPQSSRRASKRQFWGWVKKWRNETATDGLSVLLSRVVLRRTGRRGDEEKDRLRKNLPPKWVDALESVWKAEAKKNESKPRKLRKPRKT